MKCGGEFYGEDEYISIHMTYPTFIRHVEDYLQHKGGYRTNECANHQYGMVSITGRSLAYLHRSQCRNYQEKPGDGFPYGAIAD